MVNGINVSSVLDAVKTLDSVNLKNGIAELERQRSEIDNQIAVLRSLADRYEHPQLAEPAEPAEPAQVVQNAVGWEAKHAGYWRRTGPFVQSYSYLLRRKVATLREYAEEYGLNELNASAHLRTLVHRGIAVSPKRGHFALSEGPHLRKRVIYQCLPSR